MSKDHRKARDEMAQRILDHGEAQHKAGVKDRVTKEDAQRMAQEAATRASRREDR